MHITFLRGRECLLAFRCRFRERGRSKLHESCTSGPHAERSVNSAPAQKLVGIAAWNQLVGNSITGKENGETLVEYYAADGTAKSMTGNEISTGTWALVGEAVCFKYTDSDETECYKVEVTGNFVTYTDRNGTGNRYEILKGNPKGL